MVEGQQYAGGERPPRRYGPGGRDLTLPEQNQWDFFNLHRNELERLEPNNPRLPYISRPGWVPRQEDIDGMAREAAAARARAAARPQSGEEAAGPKSPPPTADDIVRGTVPGGLTDKQDRGVLRPRPPEGEGEPPRRIGDNSGKLPEADAGHKPPATSPIIPRSPQNGEGEEKPSAERRDTARKIAMHAYQEHVVEHGEFSGVRSLSDFSAHIENVMNNPTEKYMLRDGRIIYWHGPTKTLVIEDQREPHRGTAFRPTPGKAYYDRMVSNDRKANR